MRRHAISAPIKLSLITIHTSAYLVLMVLSCKEIVAKSVFRLAKPARMIRHVTSASKKLSLMQWQIAVYHALKVVSLKEIDARNVLSIVKYAIMRLHASNVLMEVNLMKILTSVLARLVNSWIILNAILVQKIALNAPKKNALNARQTFK